MSRTLAEHRATVLECVGAIEPVVLPVGQCTGLVLAEDVTALLPVPPFTNSAMDGYACRWSDLESSSCSGTPVQLPVAFDVPAGAAPAPLPTGHACRIMTGAPIPEGADVVVKVEDTDQLPGNHPLPTRVEMVRIPSRGANVRHRGEDVQPGAAVVRSGRRVDAAVVCAAVSVGRGELSVHPRPRAAVLATGSELVEAGAAPGAGQIPNSNGPMLAAMAMENDAEVVWQGVVPDDPGAMLTLLDDLAGRCDLLISAGGVSAGAFEVVRTVTEDLGAEFTHVAMQPGGPQGCGVLRLASGARLPLVALPGNPVAAFCSFHHFVVPALARMRGQDLSSGPRTVQLPAAVAWRSRPGKLQTVPVTIDADGVRPASEGGSGSHLAASLARAEGLALVPLECDEVSAGMPLEVIVLR